MTRIYVYGDESGDFKFASTTGSSKYYLVTTVTLTDRAALTALADLQDQLAWEGRPEAGFHAYGNPPPLRRRVFDAIEPHDFRVDCTILTKANAYQRVTVSNLRFWKSNWYFHLKHVAPKVATSADELMVVSASIETKMNPSEVRTALIDVVNQVAPCAARHAFVWPAHAHLGLQLADYCSWAIARKKESGNTDYYDLIKDKVKSEYVFF